MKPTRPDSWKIALGAGVLATLGMLPSARAELVYEPEVSPNAPTQVRADDREATREALEASVKAQDTLQMTQPRVAAVTAAPVTAPVMVAPAQPVAVPVAVQVQPQVEVAAPSQAVQATDQTPEVESLSKTELMRRERTREELKNEDLLQERLEELRLRDEKRRTQALLGEAPAGDQAITPIAGVTQAPQSQMVVAPVTDHPGEDAVAPVPTAAQAQQYSAPRGPYTPAAQAQMDQVGMSQAAAVSITDTDANKQSGFYISPRGGVSTMNTNGPFNANARFALGVAGGATISDNLAFEVGYTYSEYGISYGPQVSGLTYDTYTLKQNLIDANLKLYFLGPDSKIRPFVTGGFGYAMASTNYSQNLMNYYQAYGYQNVSQDYKTNSYLGTLGAGLDLKVNRTVSIGAQFKYYTVLSSNEDGNLYTGGYMMNGYVAPAAGAPAGASLSQSSFYVMTAGVNFAF